MSKGWERIRDVMSFRSNSRHLWQLSVVLGMILGFVAAYSVGEVIRHDGFHAAHWIGAIGGAATGYLLALLLLAITSTE